MKCTASAHALRITVVIAATLSLGQVAHAFDNDSLIQTRCAAARNVCRESGRDYEALCGLYKKEFEEKRFTCLEVNAPPIVFPNGDRYVGAVSEGHLTGTGSLMMSNGNFYTGDFKDGHMTGKGTLKMNGGDRYDGDFEDGHQTGDGMLTTSNGNKYEGKFQDGKLNGKGSVNMADGEKYFGEFKDNVYDGHGLLTTSDGDRYQGDFKSGKPFGERGTWVKGTGIGSRASDAIREQQRPVIQQSANDRANSQSITSRPAADCEQFETRVNRAQRREHDACAPTLSNMASVLAHGELSLKAECDEARQREEDAENNLEQCKAAPFSGSGENPSRSNVASAGSSSRATCPQNLSYMQSSLVSDMRDNQQVIQGLHASIESQIQAAGGVDKAIVLTRIQIDAQQKTLQKSQQCESQSRDTTIFASAGNPLNDTSSNIHGSCAKAIKIATDAIALNQAALEAFQCYARGR